MVDNLVKRDIGLLFVIGGDGTLHGASEMSKAVRRRNLKISIIGIPKTIDNDICGVERTFGFSTAVEAARIAINVAHEEAKGAWNGVGLVKLMGRDSGFIAAYATLANSDVNFCFIPEVPLVLDGEDGFFKSLEKRLDCKHHALVIVAEGVGQSLADQKDSSGNVTREDIGILLKSRIVEYFKSINKPLVLKYIDPSYTIRGCQANSFDSAFCLMLGQSAVHAGMAGKTNMIVGFWNRYFTNVPISLAVMERKKVNLQGDLWQTVVQTTGQAKKKPVRPF
jgi:6-phosphofructokinase 1